MRPPIRFLTTTDNVRIASCTWGDGSPLVYVRGWVSNIERSWDMPPFVSFFEPLARHHRLIFYDSRGNGLSDRGLPSIDLDALLLDLEAVMDTHAPEPAVLYGHCFGGPIAIAYAARHPERVTKLILDGTYASGSALAPRKQLDRMLKMMREEPQAATWALNYYTDPAAEQNVTLAEHYDKLRRAADFAEMEDSIKLYACGFDVDVTADLAALRLPTLVMHRRNNQAVRFSAGRDLAARIAGAQFVAQQGSAANPWFGDAAEVQRAVTSFLGLSAERGKVRSERSPLTILFSDMESSTATTQRLGDRAAQDIVHIHNEIMREALRAHDGREIKHTGDGLMASFASAAAAVACAIAVQRELEAREGAPSVRIGLNAGEPISEEDDLFGTAVQLAARACSHAAPGQILVSNVVRELTAGKGFLYSDIGEVELRGFEDPVRLFEARWRA